MRNIFLIITLFSIALLLMLSSRCTTQSPADQEFAVGSVENPLILDDYSEIDSQITYQGLLGMKSCISKSLTYPTLTTTILLNYKLTVILTSTPILMHS